MSSVAVSYRRRVRLADGRTLGFDHHNPDGRRAVFYFHGLPGSRGEVALFAPAAHLAALDLQLIAVDRPGMGISSPCPGRTIAGWPDDIAALADALGVPRFAVLGYSGGAPYALACAHALASRVVVASVVSGISPMTSPEIVAALGAPGRSMLAVAHGPERLVTLPLRGAGLAIRSARTVAARALALGFQGRDRDALRRREIADAFLASCEEALAQGHDGARVDAMLGVSPWGFDLAEIAVPVRVHHGEADRNAPAAMGRLVARSIARCEATFYPDDGHVSLAAAHAGTIFREIAHAFTA